jgi:hypothetical protein
MGDSILGEIKYFLIDDDTACLEIKLFVNEGSLAKLYN